MGSSPHGPGWGGGTSIGKTRRKGTGGAHLGEDDAWAGGRREDTALGVDCAAPRRTVP